MRATLARIALAASEITACIRAFSGRSVRVRFVRVCGPAGAAVCGRPGSPCLSLSWSARSGDKTRLSSRRPSPEGRGLSGDSRVRGFWGGQVIPSAVKAPAAARSGVAARADGLPVVSARANRLPRLDRRVLHRCGGAWSLGSGGLGRGGGAVAGRSRSAARDAVRTAGGWVAGWGCEPVACESADAWLSQPEHLEGVCAELGGVGAVPAGARGGAAGGERPRRWRRSIRRSVLIGVARASGGRRGTGRWRRLRTSTGGRSIAG